MIRAQHGIFVSVLVLSGCASQMSGLSGNSTFACKAPEGVSCMSVSGLYENSLRNNLPGMQPTPTKSDTALAPERTISPKDMQAPITATPARTPERVLRIWVAPFQSEAGDLHDQRYFYVLVQAGQWTLENNRINPQAYPTIYPLSKSVSATSTPPVTAKPPATPVFSPATPAKED